LTSDAVDGAELFPVSPGARVVSPGARVVVAVEGASAAAAPVTGAGVDAGAAADADATGATLRDFSVLSGAFEFLSRRIRGESASA
jgi:hypothetical protein